ncbi:MAG: PEP-CTERM sorting domain-containing protein [Planctomycetes bacterium]|nr:PEP-CTERM sorting domain-containing protein [Planctomycetota bacterium]
MRSRILSIALLGTLLLEPLPAAPASQTGGHTRAIAGLVPPPLRVLVPAYFYPVANSPWVRLSAAAAAYPGRIGAIGDPANGPGASVDPSYTAVFQNFRASGGTLYGYVYTSYGARPLASVIADIDAWIAMYPLDGIFLDEMDNTPGAHEAYYQALTQHVRAQLPGAPVVGNPGVSTSPSYLLYQGHPVVSTLCIQEAGTGFLSWHSDAWVAGFPRRAFYALPYAIHANGWQAAVDHAFAENCGLVYVTDDVLPNPWDTLPAYFESMLAYIQATY